MNLEKFFEFPFSSTPLPAEIKNWDSVAGEYGLDEFLLMENAGKIRIISFVELPSKPQE